MRFCDRCKKMKLTLSKLTGATAMEQSRTPQKERTRLVRRELNEAEKEMDLVSGKKEKHDSMKSRQG